MAKVNVHSIAIGKGNGTFSPKPKSRTLKIDHLDRGGFTDSNAKIRIEKDQIQQKLESFELERLQSSPEFSAFQAFWATQTFEISNFQFSGNFPAFVRSICRNSGILQEEWHPCNTS